MSASYILTYGEQTIPYIVNVDEKRKSRVAIHVDPDGSVMVDAPPDFSETAIRTAVQKRARWVFSHVVDAKDRFTHVRPKEYVSGEQVLYLGRRYILKVIPTDIAPKAPRLRGNRLEVETKSTDRDVVRGKVRGWYRVKARNYFARKLERAVQELPWVNEMPPFRLLEMSKQWGSCSTNGDVILNPILIKAPRECIEYVILHELAHLKHHDHGSAFWALIDTTMSGWKNAKRDLDGLVEVLANE